MILQTKGLRTCKGRKEFLKFTGCFKNGNFPKVFIPPGSFTILGIYGRYKKTLLYHQFF